MSSLVKYIDHFRDDFANVEEVAKELSDVYSFLSEERRVRKKKLFYKDSQNEQNEHKFSTVRE